jgi:cytochrome c-type biogenesis protein
MDISEITVGLAFLAGLAAFLSPCVFSLVPAYISYLGGRAAGGEGDSSNRFVTFTHGLAFIAGFSAVFISLGVAASAAGGYLYPLRQYIAKAGGILVVIFGLHMMRVFRIPFLEYDARIHRSSDQKWGYLSSALFGVFFSAGWLPCSGPVLGAILILAINGGSTAIGAKLLGAYSAGLAVPFLIAALGVGWILRMLRRFSKAMRTVEIVMGLVLVIVGILLFTGMFSSMARYGYYVDFGL